VVVFFEVVLEDEVRFKELHFFQMRKARSRGDSEKLRKVE
jgi:hypothetical protein